MKTVFITGASSGIGKATAKLFQEKGWNVIATMRNPKAEIELTKLENVAVLECDVTNQESITSAIRDGLKAFGSIDALVNNAGYYTIGPLEATTYDEMKREIDTNLVGLIELTRQIILHFREQRSGVIINLSSIAGVIALPLQSLYHATKWAVEGFSESLQYELRAFNIKVKIIEPGIIKTDFFGRSMTVTHDDKLKDYDDYSNRVIKNILANEDKGSDPSVVANSIYKAATDNSNKMRYLIGKMKETVHLRKLFPNRLYTLVTRKMMEK